MESIRRKRRTGSFRSLPCFFRAEICAASRLRISTAWALRVVKALRTRRFSVGSVRPTSGRNSLKRAISSASIRSVFARVPRERAKALICAGGSCRASIPAAIPDHPSLRSKPRPGLAFPGSPRSTVGALLPSSPDGTSARPENKTRPASRAIHLFRPRSLLLSCHALFLMVRGPGKRAAVNCSRR